MSLQVTSPWGLFLVLLGFACTSFAMFVMTRLRLSTELRRVPGLDALAEAVNVCAERGRPMIYSIGCMSTESGQYQSLLMSSLIILKNEAKLAAPLRVRIINVNMNPRAAMLAQQFESGGYAEGGHPEMYNPHDFRFFPTMPSVGFGLQGLVQTENAGALVGIGAHYYSSHIPAFETAHAMGSLTISSEQWASEISSSSLVADYTILQEETMAAGAYLSEDETTRASIVGQDFYRLANIALMVLFAIVFVATGTKLV